MKTIDEKVAVYRAWLEGKQIQVVNRQKTVWNDTDKPTWDWIICTYRVKPEPPAVAKAYVQVGGFVQWAINGYFDNTPNYIRAPEFDIVAKPADSHE